MIIGHRLSELRKKIRLSQKDLALILKVSEATVSLYERELVSPPDDVKIKIVKHFNISMDYLMGLTSIESYDATCYIELPKNTPDEIKVMIKEYAEYLCNKYQM